MLTEVYTECTIYIGCVSDIQIVAIEEIQTIFG